MEQEAPMMNCVNANELTVGKMLPGGRYDGGVEATVAGHGYRDGNDPVERAQDLIPKSL